jgi:Uma2 family endonuclease
MATVIDPEPAPPAEVDSGVSAGSGESVVLHGVSWKMYRDLRKMPDNYNIRMTYDRGELEIMSPSPLHEKIAALLGDLITVWRLEFKVRISCCRAMTVRRSVLERGFEPDNCYYVQHERQMWNKKKIDFKSDPPPDLAIEVEVSRRLLDKKAIYAAFGVPELWCWSGSTLTVLELSQEGEYVPRASSICLPAFPVAQAQEIVRRLGIEDDTALICSFQEWVRANVRPGGDSCE